MVEGWTLKSLTASETDFFDLWLPNSEFLFAESFPSKIIRLSMKMIGNVGFKQQEHCLYVIAQENDKVITSDKPGGYD